MDNQKKQKHISRCRFSFPHYENGKIEHQCLFEGYEDDEIIPVQKKSVNSVKNTIPGISSIH